MAAKTIQQQFEEFHKHNPQVYNTLVKEALYLKNVKGWRACAIRFLWERVRWIHNVEAVDLNTPFELNNNYHSRYVRKIEEQEPELNGFFKKRALISQ